jgi:Luciferase-like monooxygenase
MCCPLRVCRQSRPCRQRLRRPSPSRACAESDWPSTPSSGQPTRVGKFEHGAHLDDDDQARPGKTCAQGGIHKGEVVDFGIQLATSSHSWNVVKRAEALGFTHAWFYDTQLLNADVFVAMATAAIQTSRIRLCTGVLIPSNRIAPVAASGAIAIEEAPGRKRAFVNRCIVPLLSSKLEFHRLW